MQRNPVLSAPKDCIQRMYAQFYIEQEQYIERIATTSIASLDANEFSAALTDATSQSRIRSGVQRGARHVSVPQLVPAISARISPRGGKSTSSPARTTSYSLGSPRSSYPSIRSSHASIPLDPIIENDSPDGPGSSHRVTLKVPKKRNAWKNMMSK